YPKFLSSISQTYALYKTLLFTSGSCSRQEHPVVKVGEIRRHAEVFAKFSAGNQRDFGGGHFPRGGVGLWIDNGDLAFDRAIVEAAPSLDDFHFIAVSPATVRVTCADPGSFVVTIRFDHERVALPMADIPAHPTWLRRFGR